MILTSKVFTDQITPHYQITKLSNWLCLVFLTNFPYLCAAIKENH